MSSLLSKKQSHTWQKSVYAWRPLDQDGQGELVAEGPMGEVFQAIANKDAKTFALRVAANPELLTTALGRFANKSRPSTRGVLAHMILYLGWTAGVPGLYAAGDRFDTPATPEDPLTPTALEDAIWKGKVAYLRKLKSLGLDVLGPPGRPSVEILLCGAHELPKSHEAIDFLASLGVDPLARVSSPVLKGVQEKYTGQLKDLPLLEALIRRSRHYAAGVVAPSLAGRRIDDPVRGRAMSSAWVEHHLRSHVFCSLSNSYMSADKMIDLLLDAGCPLPSLAMAADYANPRHPARQSLDRDLHEKIMRKLMALPYSQQEMLDAAQVAQKWETHPNWVGELVARAQYDQMAGHVDPSRESRPSRRL